MPGQTETMLWEPKKEGLFLLLHRLRLRCTRRWQDTSAFSPGVDIAWRGAWENWEPEQ